MYTIKLTHYFILQNTAARETTFLSVRTNYGELSLQEPKVWNEIDDSIKTLSKSPFPTQRLSLDE